MARQPKVIPFAEAMPSDDFQVEQINDDEVLVGDPALDIVEKTETSFDESGTETLFDGGSTRFISKADTYVSDDRFDKYVLYPKHNIIGNEDYITNG